MADVAGASPAQITVNYPDGSDINFTQVSSTQWNGPVGTTDILYQSSNDFYLQVQKGWVYHFVRYSPGASQYYLMTDFTDNSGNDYTLTYDGFHRVTQVTEPGGRSLSVLYTRLSVVKGSFTTLATIGSDPAPSTWTEIPLPTNSTHYRYLRYLSADGGYCDLSEMQFLDASGNVITGTPFGTGPGSSASTDYTKATDGDIATYTDLTDPSGGFTGIDLGASNTQVVAKIRFYPRPGYEGRMYKPLNAFHGRFQGSNFNPGTIAAISQVTASDGRSVTYDYTSQDDAVLPNTWQCLTGVNYPEGTHDTYSYGTVFASTAPLVIDFLFHRTDAGPQQSFFDYVKSTSFVFGAVQDQLNDSNQVMATISSLNSHTPTATFPRDGGVTSNFYIEAATGLMYKETDALGHTTVYAFDSNGFVNNVKDALGHVTTSTNSIYGNPLRINNADFTSQIFTRDSHDLLLTSKDETGNITTYTRDSAHRVTRVDYPNSSYETFTYNSFGQPLTHRLRNGGTETYTYDARGLMQTKVDAMGKTWSYTYDAYDRLASVTDPLLHTTSYQYNLRGLTTQVTYADGSTHTSTYDDFGNKLTDTNEIGKTTTYTYDTAHRLLTATDPLNRTTSLTYRSDDTNTHPSEIHLPNGEVSKYQYDAEWNLLSETSAYGTGDASTTSYQYDDVYNLKTITDPRSHSATINYDVRNRPITTIDQLGLITRYTYDNDGNLLTVKRPVVGYTTYNYDNMNRVSSSIDPQGRSTNYTYDTADNLLTVKNPRNNIYTYAYDYLNRPTSLQYPNGSTETYTYDDAGRPSTYTTRSGKVMTATYDNRNRQTGYTWSDSTPGVTRTFDYAGRLLTSSNGVSTSTFTYDDANQCLSETQANTVAGVSWTLSYTYDANGRRASATYPSGTVVTYAYTHRDQLKTLSVGGTPLAGYTYDASGNGLTKTLADGTVGTATYDFDNRLTALDHTLSGTSLARFDYGYDDNDRITYEKRDSAKGDVFGYDRADQVTASDYEATNPAVDSSGASRQVTYAYDMAGNRTTVTDNVNGNKSYVLNSRGLDQYATVGGVPFGYDTNGNLISGNGLFFYNSENQLVTAQVGGHTDQLSYDSGGRVVEREVNGTATFYIYDGWNLVEERDGSNNVLASYVQAGTDNVLTRTDGSGTVYYHRDARGNVANLTNSSGTVVEKYKYDVFGKAAITDGSGTPLSASAYGNRFLFTGREYLAELNLYDYRNRVYSADTGRFLQIDPLGFGGGDVNLNRYCGNNPVNCSDPSGCSVIGQQVTVDKAGPYGWAGTTMRPGTYEIVQTDTGGFGLSRIGDVPIASLSDTKTLASVEAAKSKTTPISNVNPWDEGHFLDTLQSYLLNGGFALATLPVGGPELGAVKTVTVSRWGREGLEAGDWVMKGSANKWNYFWSGKWQPSWMPGGNIPAAFSSGKTYSGLPASSVVSPSGIIGAIKGLLGQARYTP